MRFDRSIAIDSQITVCMVILYLFRQSHTYLLAFSPTLSPTQGILHNTHESDVNEVHTLTEAVHASERFLKTVEGSVGATAVRHWLPFIHIQFKTIDTNRLHSPSLVFDWSHLHTGPHAAGAPVSDYRLQCIVCWGRRTVQCALPQWPQADWRAYVCLCLLAWLYCTVTSHTLFDDSDDQAKDTRKAVWNEAHSHVWHTAHRSAAWWRENRPESMWTWICDLIEFNCLHTVYITSLTALTHCSS